MGNDNQSCNVPEEMPVTPDKSTGYAYVEDGQIWVNTVSETEVSAMVNALAVRFRVVTRTGVTDEEIKAAWVRQYKDKGTIEKVYIST